MERSFAVTLTLACGMATAMLAINLGACGPDSGSEAGLSCQIGGKCSPSQVCETGIVGCESNCQCVGGTWQSPCPDGIPQNGSSCKVEGATCGYMGDESNNTCGNPGIDCQCRGGAWDCEPYCRMPLDGGADAAGCIAAGGECLFPNVICATPGPLSCSNATFGSYCCMSNVPDCGQPSATTYACPPAEGGLSCSSAPIPLGAPNYEALVQATESDASYPLGCRVTFPACNSGRVPYCTCSLGQNNLSGTAPVWTCFQ